MKTQPLNKSSVPQGNKGLVLLGAITGAHGLKGEVVVKVFTEEPEGLMAYGALSNEDQTASFEVTSVRALKNGLAARLKGIGNRNEAEALKGTGLYVPREALGQVEEEDEFFHTDLIGLEVRQGDAPIGTVKAVQDFGAGDLLEIQLKGRKGTVLLPFSLEAVPEVDVSGGFVRVLPPEGLWDKPGKKPPEESEGEG